VSREVVGITTLRDIGQRVRNARLEANLSQDGLADVVPGGHHLSWVSKVENGQIPGLKVADVLAIAEVTKTPAELLLVGEKTEDSEYMARLRGMEPFIDESGQRTVLATAVQQVEETQLRQVAASTLSAREAELIRLVRSEEGPRSLALLESMIALARGSSEPGVPRETPDGADHQESEPQSGTPA
jgi:transcriptional regulator with XRE-family HTH domain